VGARSDLVAIPVAPAGVVQRRVDADLAPGTRVRINRGTRRGTVVTIRRPFAGSRDQRGYLVELPEGDRVVLLLDELDPLPASGPAPAPEHGAAPVDPYRLQQEAWDDSDDDEPAAMPVQVLHARSAFRGTHSREIARSNQDCVLAAFASLTGNLDEARRHANEMTATDTAIRALAPRFGARATDGAGLLEALRAGRRAFIRAPALAGGGLHAYCAHGVDERGRVIAWDPDSDHQDNKLIPPELIDEDMIFIT
jgi:hypothetical protein